MSLVDDRVVADWEPWQRAYRHGVLLLLPPSDVVGDVDELRARYDPVSHEICRAHVTVTEPFPRPVTTADLDDVAAALAQVAPFEVGWVGPRSTDPHPGVVLLVDPPEPVLALRRLLHARPAFAGVEDRGIPPHMTIAEFLSVEASNRLARQLRGQVSLPRWTCDAVEYVVPDDRFHFEPRARLLLGGAA